MGRGQDRNSVRSLKQAAWRSGACRLAHWFMFGELLHSQYRLPRKWCRPQWNDPPLQCSAKRIPHGRASLIWPIPPPVTERIRTGVLLLCSWYSYYCIATLSTLLVTILLHALVVQSALLGQRWAVTISGKLLWAEKTVTQKCGCAYHWDDWSEYIQLCLFHILWHVFQTLPWKSTETECTKLSVSYAHPLSSSLSLLPHLPTQLFSNPASEFWCQAQPSVVGCLSYSLFSLSLILWPLDSWQPQVTDIHPPVYLVSGCVACWDWQPSAGPGDIV